MEAGTGETRAPAPHQGRSPDMSTIADVATPIPSSAAVSAGAAEVTSAGRSRRRLGWMLPGFLLLGGLSAFNIWWYWRDIRPLRDYTTISEWIQRERYTEAEAALRERLRGSPQDFKARIMLARAMAARNDYLGCARELHEVPFWCPQKAEALYREGQSYLALDRARDAERAWQEVIKDDPLHPVAPELYHDACQELLKIYAIEDRWEDAYPVIWKSYDHAEPIDHPVLLAMRMRPELERVSQKESIVVLTRYVNAAPDDWEALRALARAELAVGQHADSARHFEACLKGRPDDVRVWRDYLAMLLDQGEMESFLALLKRAPEGADNEPETWMFRGAASEKVGDWAAAAGDFRKAIELSPVVSKYYYRLATAEERLGLRDAAAAHRQRTKEINDARSQLPAAYAAFFAAKKPGKPGSQDMDAACRRLASLCETLGWLRAAQGWNRLVLSQ